MERSKSYLIFFWIAYGSWISSATSLVWLDMEASPEYSIWWTLKNLWDNGKEDRLSCLPEWSSLKCLNFKWRVGLLVHIPVCSLNRKMTLAGVILIWFVLQHCWDWLSYVYDRVWLKFNFLISRNKLENKPIFLFKWKTRVRPYRS